MTYSTDLLEGEISFDIIHSTMLAMNRHVTRTDQDLRRRNLPTRVQVLLDLEKMFTRVSRRRVHDILAEKLPHLLPLYRLNSGQATRAYIRQLDGSWTFVEQDEGLAQGCPLSPPFSCLVLAEVLAEIYDGVTLRAQTRLAAGDPGDDARSRSQRCQMHAPTKLPFRCTERSPANSR